MPAPREQRACARSCSDAARPRGRRRLRRRRASVAWVSPECRRWRLLQFCLMPQDIAVIANLRVAGHRQPRPRRGAAPGCGTVGSGCQPEPRAYRHACASARWRRSSTSAIAASMSPSISASARARRARRTSARRPCATPWRKPPPSRSYTAEDPFAGLADPAMLARDIPDLDLEHPWDLAPEQAIEYRSRLRGCRACSRFPAHQFGRRIDQQPAGCARLRQLERLPGRLRKHESFAELRSARASRARTCSATTGSPRRAMPKISNRARRSDARPASVRWPGSARERSLRDARRCCSRRSSRAG